MSAFGTAMVVVLSIAAVTLAIVFTLRHELPACRPDQTVEVRAITRECVTHTVDTVQFCYSKAQVFVGCKP